MHKKAYLRSCDTIKSSNAKLHNTNSNKLALPNTKHGPDTRNTVADIQLPTEKRIHSTKTIKLQ